MTSCKLHSLPKAPPPHAITLGLGLQYVNLEEARSLNVSPMTAFLLSASSLLPLHLARPGLLSVHHGKAGRQALGGRSNGRLCLLFLQELP